MILGLVGQLNRRRLRHNSAADADADVGPGDAVRFSHIGFPTPIASLSGSAGFAEYGGDRSLRLSLLSYAGTTDLEIGSFPNWLDRLRDSLGHDLRFLFCGLVDSRSLSSLLAVPNPAGLINSDFQPAVLSSAQR